MMPSLFPKHPGQRGRGKAEGNFLSGLNKDKTLELNSAFPPAEEVMCAWK